MPLLSLIALALVLAGFTLAVVIPLVRGTVEAVGVLLNLLFTR